MAAQGDYISDSKGRKGILIAHVNGVAYVLSGRGVRPASGVVTVISRARTANAIQQATRIWDNAAWDGLPGFSKTEAARIAADGVAYARGISRSRTNAILDPEMQMIADRRLRNREAARRYRARVRSAAIPRFTDEAGNTTRIPTGPITRANSPRLAASPIAASLSNSPPTGGLAAGTRGAATAGAPF